MKWQVATLKCILIAAFVLSGQPAYACSPVLPGSAESKEDRLERQRLEMQTSLYQCREAHAQKYDFLAAVEQGEYSLDEALAFSELLTSGAYGCVTDHATAFAILNSAVPDPIPRSIEPEVLQHLNGLLSVNLRTVSFDRGKEITGLHGLVFDWSRNDKYFWSPGEREANLLSLVNWWTAKDSIGAPGSRFSDLSSRQTVMLEHASDKSHAYWDLALARRIVQTTAEYDDDLALVSRVLAQNPTDAELEQLAGIMHWYSPVKLPFLAPRFAEVDPLARQLFVALENSKSLELKARSGQFKPFQLVLDDQDLAAVESDFAVLTDWKEVFPSLTFEDERSSRRILEIAPTRALRRGVGGAVQTALSFDEDGRYLGLEVVQSSGHTLFDDANIRTFERYVRPRLETLALPPQYVGRNTLVLLPAMVWRLHDRQHQFEGAYVDGKYVIDMVPIRDSCGNLVN